MILLCTYVSLLRIFQFYTQPLFDDAAHVHFFRISIYIFTPNKRIIKFKLLFFCVDCVSIICVLIIIRVIIIYYHQKTQYHDHVVVRVCVVMLQ